MQITPNTVKLISQNQKAHPLLSSPTLQILTIDKHINDNNQARIKAHLSDGSFYIKAIFSTKYTKHFDNAIKTNSLIKIESFEVRGKENVFVYVTEIADYCDKNEVIGNPISVGNRKESDKQGEVDRNEVFSRQNSIRNNERNESVGNSNSERNGSVSNNLRNENIGNSNSNRNDYNNNTKNVTNMRNDRTAYSNNSNAHNSNIGDLGTKKSAPLFENFPPKTIDKPLSNPNLHPSKMHDKPHNEKLRKSLDNADTKKQNTGITPISSINPFTNTYVIKGRCLSKSEIKTFKNQKGEGKLFSFVMADETGTIKVTAFSETVDMFYTLVDINKVYTISGGQVRMANKKFSNTTSEYEIHLEKSTKLNLVYDDATPKYYFKFVKMSDLIVNSSVDIVGVVKDVYEKGSVTIKSTGKEQSKRDLNLVDETGLVRTTLWGRNADLEINQGDCLVLSNVLVREYNGISLSTSSSSTVHVNLMIDECYALKGWFEQIGKDIRFERKIKDTPKLISDIKEHEIKFSSFVGTVVFVKEDNLFYKSCVECNKKVVEEDGMFRCEKCNKTFENCNLRYLARFEVGDFSDQIWVNAFDEQCKTMIGVEAKDIETENVKGLYCRDFMFKVMMKAENYQGETRNKYNVREVENVNYLNEAKRLIKAINDSLATYIEAYIQNLVIRKTLELVSLDYRRSLDDDCIGDDEIGRSIEMLCEPKGGCKTECAE